MRASAILFDKDGTLFDFQKSWGRWIAAQIERDSRGDRILAQAMADAVDFDLSTQRILPSSPLIAATVAENAERLLPHYPGMDLAALIRHLDEHAQSADMHEVTPLQPFFTALQALDLKLGVATNDSETAARAHMDGAGISGQLDFLVGYDSGFGAKPAPGMLTAFADAVCVDPKHVIMVGDSLHDLHAGRAAGMQTVAVLTGVALAEELRDHADVVLPDITHLPDWMIGKPLPFA